MFCSSSWAQLWWSPLRSLTQLQSGGGSLQLQNSPCSHSLIALTWQEIVFIVRQNVSFLFHVSSHQNIQIYRQQWHGSNRAGEAALGPSEVLLRRDTTVLLLHSTSQSNPQTPSQKPGKQIEYYEGKSHKVFLLISNLNTECISYSWFINFLEFSFSS